METKRRGSQNPKTLWTSFEYGPRDVDGREKEELGRVTISVPPQRVPHSCMFAPWLSSAAPPPPVVALRGVYVHRF